MQENNLIKKIKPIFPTKVTVNNQHSHQLFMKKRYKIFKELQLQKSSSSPSNSPNYQNEVVPFLKRTFQSLKHVQKFDLRKLTLFVPSIYKPKMKYFAKRMSRCQAVLLYDPKYLTRNRLQEISAYWLKYVKKMHHCSYILDQAHSERLGVTNYDWAFHNFLRYHIHLKDLAISFTYDVAFYLEDLCLFSQYPKALQRLSLQGLNSARLIEASLSHLSNLKHLELGFNKNAQADFMISILQLLPQVHLESFSLKWFDHLIPKLVSVFPVFKALKGLKQLKLFPYNLGTNDFTAILPAFEECPLTDFTLNTTLETEAHLILLIGFLEKFPNIESLKLKISCRTRCTTSSEKVKALLDLIDNLALLRNLSLSIFGKGELLIERNSPLFTKIFTKSVPLESFRIKVKPLGNTPSNFLQLLEGLKNGAGNLKKLKINIGQHSPVGTELKEILGLIRGFKGLRSLKLKGLSISDEEFFVEWDQMTKGLPYLRSVKIRKC